MPLPCSARRTLSLGGVIPRFFSKTVWHLNKVPGHTAASTEWNSPTTSSRGAVTMIVLWKPSTLI
jgi:hypothetical protein